MENLAAVLGIYIRSCSGYICTDDETIFNSSEFEEEVVSMVSIIHIALTKAQGHIAVNERFHLYLKRSTKNSLLTCSSYKWVAVFSTAIRPVNDHLAQKLKSLQNLGFRIYRGKTRRRLSRDKYLILNKHILFEIVKVLSWEAHPGESFRKHLRYSLLQAERIYKIWRNASPIITCCLVVKILNGGSTQLCVLVKISCMLFLTNEKIPPFESTFSD